MNDNPGNKSQILIVDDNASFLELFLSLPEAQAYHVIPVTTAHQAFDVLAQTVVELVITDIAMPEMSGLDFFKRLHQLQPELPVILITAYGCTQDAINAIQLGAFHYFEKPINTQFDLFWSTVRQAIARNQMQWQIASHRKETALRKSLAPPLIGESDTMRRVFDDISEVADLDVNVLITGETGTGKSMLAAKIHAAGRRKENS